MGQVVPFADGDIFSKPTFFPMTGNRIGMLGEAGPEAIMPLKNRDGRFGVLGDLGGVETVFPLKRMANGSLGIHLFGLGEMFDMGTPRPAPGPITRFTAGDVFPQGVFTQIVNQATGGEGASKTVNMTLHVHVDGGRDAGEGLRQSTRQLVGHLKRAMKDS